MVGQALPPPHPLHIWLLSASAVHLPLLPDSASEAQPLWNDPILLHTRRCFLLPLFCSYLKSLSYPPDLLGFFWPIFTSPLKFSNGITFLIEPFPKPLCWFSYFLNVLINVSITVLPHCWPSTLPVYVPSTGIEAPWEQGLPYCAYSSTKHDAHCASNDCQMGVDKSNEIIDSNRSSGI